MKLIIDISEEEYELIVNDEACGLNPLTRAVAHGIPLDKIKSEIEKEGQQALSYPNWEYAKGLQKALKIIDKHIGDIK